MEATDLYIKVKRHIAQAIFNGTYNEGERLPSERALSEELGVSRVTVRKALAELGQEQLLQREVGRGTQIAFHNLGHKDSLDSICLVAPAKTPFFSSFIEALQMILDKQDILLIYVQKSKYKSLEDCLFKLYKRELYNTVIWPDDEPLDEDKLKRLRAIGMNMTFFDTNLQVKYADRVLMDNRKAMKDLLKAAGETSRPALYLGWDNYQVYSVKCREDIYRQEQVGQVAVRTVSWKQRMNPDEEIRGIVSKLPATADVFCGSGEIGLALGRVLGEEKGRDVRIYSIDEFPQSQAYNITTVAQDYSQSATAVLASLTAQCSDEGAWQAKSIKVPGQLISR